MPSSAAMSGMPVMAPPNMLDIIPGDSAGAAAAFLAAVGLVVFLASFLGVPMDAGLFGSTSVLGMCEPTAAPSAAASAPRLVPVFSLGMRGISTPGIRLMVSMKPLIRPITPLIPILNPSHIPSRNSLTGLNRWYKTPIRVIGQKRALATNLSASRNTDHTMLSKFLKPPTFLTMIPTMAANSARPPIMMPMGLAVMATFKSHCAPVQMLVAAAAINMGAAMRSALPAFHA